MSKVLLHTSSSRTVRIVIYGPSAAFRSVVTGRPDCKFPIYNTPYVPCPSLTSLRCLCLFSSHKVPSRITPSGPFGRNSSANKSSPTLPRSRTSRPFCVGPPPSLPTQSTNLLFPPPLGDTRVHSYLHGFGYYSLGPP